MRTLFLVLGLLFCGNYSSAQKKMTGIGAELSVLSFKPTVRLWISKKKGLDFFAGVSSELSDFKPNDYEGGIKYLNAFMYNRTSRTYFGAMGKWKRIKPEETHITVNLPVFGVLIGKEWYFKRARKKGFAAELGYQYGAKKYEIYNPVNNIYIGQKKYEEFPLILNLRYSFHKDR